MTHDSVKPASSGFLSNACPFCHRGRVFYGLYKMHRNCPACGIKFERESGYFLGAMILSYFISSFSLVPTVILLVFYFHASLAWIIIVPSIQVILMNPLLFKYSRLIWLRIDQRAERRQ
ncbi:MAG: DUF983 domain-containing protein [Methylotenera sp.]|nr:DUF983 domain-containing protein [Oligoflexia bacterium]